MEEKISRAKLVTKSVNKLRKAWEEEQSNIDRVLSCSIGLSIVGALAFSTLSSLSLVEWCLTINNAIIPVVLESGFKLPVEILKEITMPDHGVFKLMPFMQQGFDFSVNNPKKSMKKGKSLLSIPGASTQKLQRSFSFVQNENVQKATVEQTKHHQGSLDVLQLTRQLATIIFKPEHIACLSMQAEASSIIDANVMRLLCSLFCSRRTVVCMCKDKMKHTYSSQIQKYSSRIIGFNSIMFPCPYITPFGPECGHLVVSEANNTFVSHVSGGIESANQGIKFANPPPFTVPTPLLLISISMKIPIFRNAIKGEMSCITCDEESEETPITSFVPSLTVKPQVDCFSAFSTPSVLATPFVSPMHLMKDLFANRWNEGDVDTQRCWSCVGGEKVHSASRPLVMGILALPRKVIGYYPFERDVCEDDSTFLGKFKSSKEKGKKGKSSAKTIGSPSLGGCDLSSAAKIPLTRFSLASLEMSLDQSTVVNCLDSSKDRVLVNRGTIPLEIIREEEKVLNLVVELCEKVTVAPILEKLSSAVSNLETLYFALTHKHSGLFDEEDQDIMVKSSSKPRAPNVDTHERRYRNDSLSEFINEEDERKSHDSYHSEEDEVEYSTLLESLEESYDHPINEEDEALEEGLSESSASKSSISDPSQRKTRSPSSEESSINHYLDPNMSKNLKPIAELHSARARGSASARELLNSNKQMPFVDEGKEFEEEEEEEEF
eukprot:gnl/Carplike_NY0171/3553_a4795_244.p1 GENE.gnl/Carplike_NY0171/3553_a4795_244~~gnl/Carplike_NY0171/3553_a4795_244.p1  ORF type:complete len:799 (+),score=223.68 gnl/Carplike_NY0171/3553_a4795_244:238-2397(+)